MCRSADKTPQQLSIELARAEKQVRQLQSQLSELHRTIGAASPTAAPAEELSNLTALINSCQDRVWLVDKNKHLLLINDSAKETCRKAFGIEPIPGMSSAEITSSELVDYWDGLYESAFKGESFRLCHPAEDKRVYSVTIQPVRTATEVIGAAVFGHDITEQYQLQAELAHYKQIISSTPDMISLVDRDYVYQVVNDAYLKNYQKQRDELLGKTVREVVGVEIFERISKPNLERAFCGETVCVEDWLELPEMGRRYLAVTYHPVNENGDPPEHVAINVRDITSLKLAEADRQRIFDVSLDMLCVASFDGYQKELNPAWARTLGWKEEELKSRHWLEFIVPSDHEATIAANARLLQGKSLVGFENRFQCKDGSIKWISWNSFPDLENKQVFAVARDVTERRKLEEELRRLATTDPLTGADNRRHFIEQAAAELKRSRRYGAPLAVVMLDIDHFKAVNDNYGHDAGDEVLKRLVDCCLQTLRSSDLFGRFGGEEFAAILPETNQEAALQTCKRLAKNLEKTRIRTSRGEISITVSIGMTMLSGPDQTIDALLKRADNALYEAKNSGRNKLIQH